MNRLSPGIWVVSALSSLGLTLGPFFSTSAYGQANWSAEVSAGYGYESNVTVDEIDLNASVGDQFYLYNGKVGVDYDFGNEQSLKFSYKFSERAFTDVDGLDLTSQFFSTGYSSKFGKWNTGVDYRHVDSDLDDNDFLSINMVSPYVSGFLAKQHFVRLAWTHANKNLVVLSERDATSNELATDYYYFIDGLTRFLIVSFKYKNENAFDRQFSYDGLQLRVAYEYRFELYGLPSKARIDARARRRDFDDLESEAIGRFRRDDRERVSASLETAITPDLDLVIEASYVENESDLDFLDFTESMLSTTATYRF